MTDRRLHPAVVGLLWAAAGLTLPMAGPIGALIASQPGDGSPAVATIESMYVLEDAPLPLPAETPAASRALDFRFGGISDLFRSETAADGTIHLWGITDRGPNGFVEKPASDGSPAKPLRTLPVPTFQPLLVKLALEASAAAGEPGTLRVVEVKPITAANGGPTTGRPAVAPPRSKPMVDPATALPLPSRVSVKGPVWGSLATRRTRSSICRSTLTSSPPASAARVRQPALTAHGPVSTAARSRLAKRGTGSGVKSARS